MKEILMPMAKGVVVKEIRIGLRYTAVMLQSGQTGVALTFSESLGGCHILDGVHPLLGKESSVLLEFIGSGQRIEAAVAMATANALINTERDDMLEGDILDHLDLHPEDRVAMIGYFAPLVPRLKRLISSLYIFEERQKGKADVLPADQAYRILPDCQVAVVTSTAIINHTVDGLLEAAGNCREVVLLGASTPMIPELFKDTPVTYISGIIVESPKDILRIVSEGGGVRAFRGHTKKVNLGISKAGPRESFIP
jgi:uncharacterized protein (DUF4213/DUF364 family)